MQRPPEHDERTVAVDNAGGNSAFRLMNWLLLLDILLHSIRPDWVNWGGFPADLYIILLVGGLVAAGKNLRARIHPNRYYFVGVLIAMGSALLAAALVLLRH